MSILCLVPELRGKTFSFSLFSMMLAVDLSCGLYYFEVHFLCTHFVESFDHKWMLNFVRHFSASIEMITWFLSFILLMGCITLICRFEPFLHSWTKSHLIMVYDPFNALLDSVCWYFVEDLFIYVHQ